MPDDKEILSEKLKTERHLLGIFKITFIIGLLICGLILYIIIGYILRYYSLQYTPDFEFNLLGFVFFFAIFALFLVAPIGGIIVIANCFMLRKLHELELPKRHYTLPYASILINAVPAFISVGIIIYFMYNH